MSKNIMTMLGMAVKKEKLNIALTDSELSRIYNILNNQDLAHLVGYLLQENNALPQGDIGVKFADSVFKAIFRYERNNYELERIMSAFEESGIPFIPMKGAVIKDLYPLPWMRTVSDIDILIKKEDIKMASDVLGERLGFFSTAYGTPDVSFENKSQVHLELHYCLVEENEFPEIANVTKEAWAEAEPVEGYNYRYAMSDEMFYFYNIAHMYKHFKYGGCGIKPFLDTYVFTKKTPENTEKRNELLEKGGILRFNKGIVKACKVWFEGENSDPMTNTLKEYILNGGLYGSMTNKAAMNKITHRQDNKGFLEKLWKPYSELKFWYPALEKHKILLPFYQLKRWLYLLCGGMVEDAIKEKSETKKVRENEIEDIKILFNDLGIK